MKILYVVRRLESFSYALWNSFVGCEEKVGWSGHIAMGETCPRGLVGTL
jgi:hypothetical protein